MNITNQQQERKVILIGVTAGLIVVYLLIGLWRIVEVASGGYVQPIPFLDAPWKLIFRLVA